MTKATLKLKLKSPLRTGDIDSKSDLIQSTGIVGSLRWWTEAILRGMGNFVCDPTDDNRCPEGKKENGKEIQTYCPACLIWGATGIRRLFKVELSGGERLFESGAINIKPEGRDRGWYLGSGLTGQIELRIVQLSNDFNENFLLIPLIIASEWGGIGAKTQHGYGVVKIEDSPSVNFDSFTDAIYKMSKLERLSGSKLELRSGNTSGFPCIKEMFFAKVQFNTKNNEWWKEVDGIEEYANDERMNKWVKSGSVPIAPVIKNWLRFGNGKKFWQTNNQNNREIENWLFGNIRNDKKASKINISCAYPVGGNLWELRIWGWIPKDYSPSGFNRESFLDNLKGTISGSNSFKIPWNELLGDQTENHSLSVWREFNSQRDTVKQNEDINAYLESLLIKV